MSKPTRVLGITGGISTGKSTFARRLHQLTGAKLFDADRAAHRLSDEDAEVRIALRARFGAEIFSASGDLNRAALRSIVFADQEEKRALEQILHPRIRQQWATEAENSRRSGDIFLADIPLLYETEGEKFCDRVLVVACAREIQLQRLTARTRLTTADALRLISAQMPLPKKILLADHVVWNNGPLSLLEAQAEMMARYLTAR